jgi:hypothetical protein
VSKSLGPISLLAWCLKYCVRAQCVHNQSKDELPLLQLVTQKHLTAHLSDAAMGCCTRHEASSNLRWQGCSPESSTPNNKPGAASWQHPYKAERLFPMTGTITVDAATAWIEGPCSNLLVACASCSLNRLLLLLQHSATPVKDCV